MAYCPQDCVTDDIITNQSADCETKVRERSPDKIAFFPCTVPLPSPFNCAALEALAAANTLALSSPLANIEIGDPEFAEFSVSDCRPSIQIPAGRAINFQDRIAIDIDNSAASPATPSVPFFNYDFWQDKVDKSATLRCMVIYCDGSVEVAKDRNGNYLEATITATKKFEKVTVGRSVKTFEYIQGNIAFSDDPFGLWNKPELTASGAIFNINECSL